MLKKITSRLDLRKTLFVIGLLANMACLSPSSSLQKTEEKFQSDSSVLVEIQTTENKQEKLLDSQPIVADSVEPKELPLASWCLQNEQEVRCSHQTKTLNIPAFWSFRDVHWQLPKKTPPPEGWPVVLMFQGSFYSAQLNWAGKKTDSVGLYYQAETVKTLLDNGYAVLTPETHLKGATYWDTNVFPYSVYWETSPDHAFVSAILSSISKGDFGKIDSQRIYALGFSSGGCMTSRMGISYPAVGLKALAIVSANYATCLGSQCSTPSTLPSFHPPTLFLHGAKDTIVPVQTMQDYAKSLQNTPIQTRVISSPSASHEWIAGSAKEILLWFQSFP